jgi:hypothetical protein
MAKGVSGITRNKWSYDKVSCSYINGGVEHENIRGRMVIVGR